MGPLLTHTIKPNVLEKLLACVTVTYLSWVIVAIFSGSGADQKAEDFEQ